MIMQKTYIGEVIKSEDGSFADKTGEKVTLWRLSLGLSEEKSITFHISADSPIYDDACRQEEGTRLEVVAEAVPTFDGKIKWRAVEIGNAPSYDHSNDVE